jgi:hypothetical protein
MRLYFFCFFFEVCCVEQVPVQNTEFGAITNYCGFFCPTASHLRKFSRPDFGFRDLRTVVVVMIFLTD